MQSSCNACICIDPVTKAWLEDHKHPVFGFPSLVRFSWGTCTSHIKDLVEVLWLVIILNSCSNAKTFFFGEVPFNFQFINVD